MSRTYRKTGIIKCLKTGKYYRRYTNSIVRHYKHELPNGTFYKKLFDTWPICDWFDAEELEDVIKGYIDDGYPLEEGYSYWKRKYYCR